MSILFVLNSFVKKKRLTTKSNELTPAFRKGQALYVGYMLKHAISRMYALFVVIVACTSLPLGYYQPVSQCRSSV